MRNIWIKNLLINTVFRAVSFINKIIPKNKNKILLYANEGFRDNIYYLYKYLKENDYEKKYTIICSASDYKEHENKNTENIKFVSKKMGILHFFTSSAVYYCFGRIPITPSKNQRTIQMWHGTSFKGFDKTMQKTNSVKNQFYTHVYASSEFFRPIVEKKFACKPENVYICGHPRTDCFYNGKKLYNLGKFNKVIMWLPTFRKSDKLGYADTDTENIVPFYKTEELKELDALARKNNILLIVKFHPMQDIGKNNFSNLKNVRFYSHRKFSKKYDLYELLKQTDALITDYSSVFYDYLLLDKPIGFTEDDEKQYAGNRGFAVDNPDDFKPGMRIRTKKDFVKFITDVASDVDKYREKRKKINYLSNQYQDGRNCQRTLAVGNVKL